MQSLARWCGLIMVCADSMRHIDQKPAYLLLETQNFDGAAERPLTSFVRLGAVQARDHVADVCAMRARRPERGAVSAATGAGEDLAARVVAFRDDDRDRCDPPELDAPEDAAAAVRARVALDDKLAAWRASEARLSAIEQVLARVLDDADGWLRSLHEEWLAADTLAARLAGELAEHDEASATAAEVTSLGIAASVSPDFTPKASRRATSAALHTRGGWRDHTDGNRIVTTRGDKVEVVRGNYRQLVLGRRTDPKDALGISTDVGWDISGGHIIERSLIVSQETVIAWTRRQNGTWRAVETTRKSDTEQRAAGDSESLAFGHRRRTTVGSESPSGPWHPADQCAGDDCRINPKLVSRVWAEKLDSQTGSSGWRVPLISDATWTRRLESTTDATTAVDVTKADTLRSRTEVDDTLTNELTVGVMRSTTVAGAIYDITTSAMAMNLLLGRSKQSQRGASTSVTLAASAEVTIGAQTSSTLGASASVSIGNMCDAFVGLRLSVSMGAKLDVIVGTSDEVSAARSIELSLLTSTDVAPAIVLSALSIDVG